MTLYHPNLSVVDDNSIRKLISGIGMAHEQSAIDINDLRCHVFDYSLLALYSFLFVKNPSRVLIVGLGGGIIPREIAYYFPSIFIDIIEIDPEMVNIAKKFFFFEKSDNMNIHIGDAFGVSKELDEKYDIIILDACISSYIPFHLMTIDFFKNIKRIVNDRGVIAANICNTHPSFNSQVNTFREIFGENIYRLDGINNVATTMLYITNEFAPVSELLLPNQYYPKLVPQKFEFTKEVKNAKIFVMKNV